MEKQEIEYHKKLIDKMSQYEMAKLYCLSPIGHYYFTGELGEYFLKKFKEKGEITEKIIKQLKLDGIYD